MHPTRYAALLLVGREGALIGGALTVLALWRSRWIALPGALIAVPLGATIGALVGGAFTRDEPPAE